MFYNGRILVMMTLMWAGIDDDDDGSDVDLIFDMVSPHSNSNISFSL